MIDQTGCLRRRLALQRRVRSTQIVVTLEQLHLSLKRRSTLGEIPSPAMQRRDLLSDRPIEPLEQRGRDLWERDRLFISEDHSSAHRHQSPPFALFDHLPVAQPWVRHNPWFFRSPAPPGANEVNEDREDDS